jgi:integral membrane sensor domain MASE1
MAGKLGLQLASVHASATAIWPPTGIAIAAVLLFGYGLWPAIMVGRELRMIELEKELDRLRRALGGSTGGP